MIELVEAFTYFQIFSEKGFEFDTGLHYMGTEEKMLNILKLISAKNIEFNNFKNFDMIQFLDDKFLMSGP